MDFIGYCNTKDFEGLSSQHFLLCIHRQWMPKSHKDIALYNNRRWERRRIVYVRQDVFVFKPIFAQCLRRQVWCCKICQLVRPNYIKFWQMWQKAKRQDWKKIFIVPIWVLLDTVQKNQFMNNVHRISRNFTKMRWIIFKPALISMNRKNWNHCHLMGI